MLGYPWITALAGLLLAGTLAVPVAPTPTPAASLTSAPPQASDARDTGSRLVVGDSLTVGARVALRQRGFVVHARVGRQFRAAPAILRSYGQKLPRNVVVALGTNGPVALSTCKVVVRIAGKNRRVFLVTNRVPRPWQAANNRTLRRCDRAFPAVRVAVVDWYRISSGHRSWMVSDGIHHTTAGRAAFVRALDRAVDKYGR
jgi:hypothetical protein